MGQSDSPSKSVCTGGRREEVPHSSVKVLVLSGGNQETCSLPCCLGSPSCQLVGKWSTSLCPQLFPSPHPAKHCKVSFPTFLLLWEELGKKHLRKNSFVQKYRGNWTRVLQHHGGSRQGEKNLRRSLSQIMPSVLFLFT